MKWVVCVVFVWSCAFGIDTKVVRTNIDSVQKDTIVFDAKNLLVGESGVVLTKNQTHAIIIASATIESIENGRANARFDSFDTIEQHYLPTPINKPQVGDEVLFRSFYNRAFVIAPNQESYQFVIRNNPKIHFMHIDLFAAYLQQESLNDPKPKHFREFCPKYSIGLVFIVDSAHTKVFDCQSFALLETQSPPPSEILHSSTLAPFFSRISHPDKPLGSRFKSNDSKDYFSYYDALVQKQE
ncbi:plasminogen-binding N-terminal domain-containing protein [uncultured Helicobacter sp.]|uniref:plasminogen-binding N-terminal domain-containing protein n=1 Tax=uncultured Helicobacter sp. TaxID=175537 RepID=UPI001C3C19A5|nr:plasminogen-binding N-terminal domain-containing protein [Candidatus Helicobacter avicola]